MDVFRTKKLTLDMILFSRVSMCTDSQCGVLACSSMLLTFIAKYVSEALTGIEADIRYGSLLAVVVTRRFKQIGHRQ